MTDKIRFGVIGGSGVYQMEALQNIEEVTLETPFGAPSDNYMIGTLHNQRVRLSGAAWPWSSHQPHAPQPACQHLRVQNVRG